MKTLRRSGRIARGTAVTAAILGITTRPALATKTIRELEKNRLPTAQHAEVLQHHPGFVKLLNKHKKISPALANSLNREYWKAIEMIDETYKLQQTILYMKSEMTLYSGKQLELIKKKLSIFMEKYANKRYEFIEKMENINASLEFPQILETKKAKYKKEHGKEPAGKELKKIMKESAKAAKVRALGTAGIEFFNQGGPSK
ncbi:MAG: hypothetical protein WC308_00310 [archaeon]